MAHRLPRVPRQLEVGGGRSRRLDDVSHSQGAAGRAVSTRDHNPRLPFRAVVDRLRSITGQPIRTRRILPAQSALSWEPPKSYHRHRLQASSHHLPHAEDLRAYDVAYRRFLLD